MKMARALLAPMIVCVALGFSPVVAWAEESVELVVVSEDDAAVVEETAAEEQSVEEYGDDALQAQAEEPAEEQYLQVQSTPMTQQTYFALTDAFLADARWSDGTSWGWQTPKISNWTSWQCYAYACDFAKYMYGVDNYEEGEYFDDISEVRTGDVIRAGGHSFVVLERKGNYLRTCEGNYSARVRVADPGYEISGNGFIQLGAGRTIAFEKGYHFYTGGATTRAVADGSEPELVSIADAQVKLKTSSCVYNGKARKPKVAEVTLGGRALDAGVDYEVTYDNNKNAGTAHVVVTGVGAYTGSVTKNFTIQAKDVSELEVSGLKTRAYTGKAIKPKPVVTDGTKTLTLGTDYTLSYQRNKNVGTARVVVTGMGNYAGTRTDTFKIKKAKNPLEASVRKSTVTVNYRANRARTVRNITVAGAQGAVTYEKVSGSKRVTVNAKTGKLTVKKGTKAGRYKITVRVRAAGNANYKAATATVSFKVVVKYTPYDVYQPVLAQATQGTGVFAKQYRAKSKGLWKAHLGYGIYDIDANGTPELIVEAGTTTANLRRYVFTIASNKVVFMGEYANSGMDAGDAKGQLYAYGSNNTSWWVSRVDFGDGAAALEQVGSGVVSPDEPSLSDYLAEQGLQRIEMNDVTDYAALLSARIG